MKKNLLVSNLLAAALATASMASQSSSAKPVTSSDQSDARVYRTLLRRVSAYSVLADTAEVSGVPKPHLRHVVATHFGLNDVDDVNLKALATLYKQEAGELQRQVFVSTRKLHTRFPLGHVPAGSDITIPPELSDLGHQQDALALRYHDLIRNAMTAKTFLAFDLEVHKAFATPTL